MMRILWTWGWIMKNVREYSWTMILALALFAPAAWAQQPAGRVNPPIPPDVLPTGESSSKQDPNVPVEPGKGPMIPDTRPLSGAEQFTLGQMGKARNYLLPSFESFETIDTNPGIAGTQSNVLSATSLIGRIAVQRIWSHFQFTADYRGGGILYSPQSELTTSIHDFQFVQRIDGRRWSLLLSDQLGYFPESSFGFGGFYSGQSSLAASLNPVFQPSQSILTVRATRLSNTAVGEVQYTLTRKSSFTASASYGILRFQQAGFVNNSNVAVSTGYSYNPTPRNTIALLYGFSSFHFEGTAQRVYDHNVHLSYGRRITGRLALELSAGPDLYTFRNPLAGPTRQLSWGLASAWIYRFRKTDLNMTYTSYLTGGAGALSGARSDQVSLTATTRLSRKLSSLLDLGYARNTAFQQTTKVTGNPAFDTWYAGLQLRRPIGRYMDVYADYHFYYQRQSSDIALCAVSICGGPTTLRHHFGIGFDWHRRPIPLG
jgi:hypothetical protein